MSREGLRALARKLASDKEFKKRVLCGDKGALGVFDLSGEEREAVIQTRQRLALATNAGQLETEDFGPLAFWL